jgi:quinoprotein glucose dehydrogenase
MFRILIASLILLIGASLTVGGIWLVALAGSWAYLLIGLGLSLSALLLLQRKSWGLGIYAATLLATLAWGFLEVGPDWWALSARGSLLVVFGILLLPVAYGFVKDAGRNTAGYALASRRAERQAYALATVLLICGAGGVYAMMVPSHDMPGTIAADRISQPAPTETQGVAAGDWSAYGRTAYGQRYSPLDKITPQNVSALKVAWSYNTGQLRKDSDPGETTYEVTPLVINDTMYICTPFSTVIALDPVTGAEKWRFDPQLRQPPKQTTQHMTCRGVSYFDGSKSMPAQSAANGAPPAVPTEEVTTAAAGVVQSVVTGEALAGAPNPVVNREPAGQPNTSPDCLQRLYVPTSDGRLINISAKTGAICPGFGGADGAINLWANMPNVTPGSAYSTSPPLITNHMVIVGGAVNDNVSATSPSGVIRAYDLWTGALIWNFDAKNPEALAPIPAGQTYSENAPNSWSIASYDADLNMVYLPMGNESPDQFGGNRAAVVDKYSASVLALDADTGKVAWVFRTMNHDLWDMDVPAQPSLIDLTIKGETVPALVQPTKQGEVFVLNRKTGAPILPVTEEPAPLGGVEGEKVAATQPVSKISFAPPPLTEASMWGATPIDQMICRIRFHQLRYEGRYTPPSLQGSIIYPGNFGTFNWGGVAVDPARQVMFGMPVYLAFTVKLVPRKAPDDREVTAEGAPVFNENFETPYAAEISAFKSPLGLPCQQPPWGYVAAVDLTTGEKIYQHVNGTVRDLSPLPMPFKMGVPGIGGPIITAGGMAFLSGTLDYYVRGYDLATGAEIWRGRLPAGGQATPSTYLGADGRQYLVVVAGGHGSTGTKAGDAIIAYALPKG